MSAVVLQDHFASTTEAKKSRNMHNVYVGAAVTFSAVGWGANTVTSGGVEGE